MAPIPGESRLGGLKAMERGITEQVTTQNESALLSERSDEREWRNE